MRWYLNDSSLQGQFKDSRSFEEALRRIVEARQANSAFSAALSTTRLFAQRLATKDETAQALIFQIRDRDLRGSVITWLAKDGPFIEDDRAPEPDDYFECLGVDVTDAGLGEAARRAKSRVPVAAFTFADGVVDFATTPLVVDHGLAEDRLGAYEVPNSWTIEDLRRSIEEARPPIQSWSELVVRARELFPNLVIPDLVFERKELARESFDPVIAEKAIMLMGLLDTYMADRAVGGAEGPRARDITRTHFEGDKPLLRPESASNRDDFRSELTFPDPQVKDHYLEGHWHGIISRRFFRLHFEWPVAAAKRKLAILYIGPKITKA